MGYLITPTNEKIEIQPVNEKSYTIKEITNLVGGLVEPLFLGNWWIFKNKINDNHTLNIKMSKSVGVPIYGNCFMAAEFELEPYFFFPREYLLEMVSALGPEFKEEIQKKFKMQDEESFKKEKVVAYETIYQEMFGKGRRGWKQAKIFYDNYQKIMFESEKEINLIDAMMNFFIESEEYEKCKKLSEFQKYIEKDKK